MKLNIKAFTVACAVVWGLGLFLLTWWIILFEGATGEAMFIGRVYRGYTISPVGSFIGLLWALVDGAVAGAIFAWLYNIFVPPATPDKEYASAVEPTLQGDIQNRTRGRRDNPTAS